MARKHAPRLVQPDQVVSRETGRALGLRSQLQDQREMRRVVRKLATATAPVADETGTIIGHVHPLYPIIADKAVTDHTAQSVSSTTGTTIVNFNLGPLVAGVPYLVKMACHIALNAPSSGFIYAVARIEASGTNVDGMDTGTVSGERTMAAFAQKIVIGTGASINIAGRARVTSGTGSANSGLVWAEAIPLLTMANQE